MIRRVAFKKALLAGATGAFAWDATYRILQPILPGGFDLVHELGTLIFPKSSAAVWWPMGMAVHAFVGAIWAVFYAYFFWSSLKIRPFLQGLTFSSIPAIAAGLTLLPQLRLLHPEMVVGLTPPPGFFAIHLGWIGPFELFFLHWVYGLVLGALYRRPAGHSVHSERHPLQWTPLRVSPKSAPPSIVPPSKGFMFCTGIECSSPTLQQGTWRMDELELTGHYQHWEQDLELVAELQIPYLRYGPPIHWIYKGPGRYDWSFSDAVFHKMRELGITPLVDLCHFGVPTWIGGFQNPELAPHLTEYALAMQARYSWLRFWNPVNEMYVAARESALHGTWNEQERSEGAFVRAAFHLAQASHSMMTQLLEKQPDAVFVTSESSEFYQPCCPDEHVRRLAHFENERRFLPMDLLLSQPIQPEMRDYVLQNGIQERDLSLLAPNSFKSRVIQGLDYYPWNEKLVDTRGGIESLGELFGWYVITRQYYDRYRLPILHSETNSMDARRGPDWLWRQWHNVQYLRGEGVPVMGFTWYSLQDQVDWDIGMSVSQGNVNPVGLYDLNRDPRGVSVAYQQLLRMYHGTPAPSPYAEVFAL